VVVVGVVVVGLVRVALPEGGVVMRGGVDQVVEEVGGVDRLGEGGNIWCGCCFEYDQ